MIGHYLLTLTKEQEDRVLTTSFRDYGTAPVPVPRGMKCLVQAIEPTFHSGLALQYLAWGGTFSGLSPASEYERLCERFGFERVNRLIRDRIFSNQARRELMREVHAVA